MDKETFDHFPIFSCKVGFRDGVLSEGEFHFKGVFLYLLYVDFECPKFTSASSRGKSGEEQCLSGQK